MTLADRDIRLRRLKIVIDEADHERRAGSRCESNVNSWAAHKELRRLMKDLFDIGSGE